MATQRKFLKQPVSSTGVPRVTQKASRSQVLELQLVNDEIYELLRKPEGPLGL